METTKTVKTETKTRGEKKPANSTQVTKAHRQLNNLKHQGSNPACGLCRIVWRITFQSESFQFVLFGVCVNWAVPLFLFAGSVSDSHEQVFLLWSEWPPCSAIWSHVLNNNWDITPKNYYRQNTSWLSVSNNALDHEISGSDNYPEMWSLVGRLRVYYDRMQGGPDELSRDDWEARRVRGVRVGSTSDDGGNNLYHPITMLDRSSSSSKIWATPIKHLWSILP